MLSYKEQVQTAQQAYPQATVTQFTPNVAVNRSAEVVVATAEGRDLNVFVDPYAGKVLGVRDEERNLQAIARKIHGTLLIGDWGDYLIELAVSWALVLLVSGLYLWLPRKNISLMGTLIPRLCSKNKRIFWRDLHAVPGFYGVLLIGFLILTGLPWTGFWGDTFAQVWGRFPEKMWDNVPQSTLVTGSLNERGTLFVPWAAESMPMPVSTAIPNASSGSNSIASKNVGYDAMLVADSSGAMNGMSPVFDSIVALAIKEGHRLDLALRFQ